MAVIVQFDHHATIDGVNYVPGMVASLADLTAQPLIFAGRVHVVDQNTPVSNGTPTGSDPYPQYLLPSELEAALPGRLSQASLNATFNALLSGYTPSGGGGGGGTGGSVTDNGDGTGDLSGGTGGGGGGSLSSSDADALVTRAFELSVAYMRDYFAGT